MPSLDDIVLALQTCSNSRSTCDRCIYRSTYACVFQMMKDAADKLIELRGRFTENDQVL